MYITHVQDFGPFLKIYGQVNKEEAVNVERAIHQLTLILNNNLPPEPKNITKSLICLARYIDGTFYRSKITELPFNGFVNVYFIDYGNEEKIPLSEIRLINFEQSQTHFLRSAPPQAKAFILSRIFGKWTNDALEIIRKEICNESIDTNVEDQAAGLKFIGLTYKNRDYSEALVNIRNLGNLIELSMQKNVLLDQTKAHSMSQQQPPHNQSLQSRLNPNIQRNIPVNMDDTNTSNSRPFGSGQNQRPQRQMYVPPIRRDLESQFTGPNMPNYHPPIISNKSLTTDIVMLQQQQLQQSQYLGKPLKAITKSSNLSTSISTYKSNTLLIGTTHDVYCSYIQDGPNLFSIQLASTENYLRRLMEQIKMLPLRNITNKVSVGMACIARFSKDKELYRAVIVNMNATACQVDYVDFGYAELVSYPNLYEVPDEFLIEKIFAMRFALSGYKSFSPLNDTVRNKFKNLVLEKKLRLKVMPLEGPPFVQYCELYDGNKNIFEILNENNQPRAILTFSQPMVMDKNYKDMITIRYVESPQRFFVQPISNASLFDDVMDRLLSHCEKANQFTDFRKGAVCAVYEDMEWYRGEILKVNRDKVLIKFVDYGNTQEVDKSALKEITSEFIVTPAQAIECCLVGFEKDKTISDSARVQLEMISEDTGGKRKKLHLEVLDKLPNGVPLVNLFDTSNDPPLNISKRMYKHTMPQRKFNDFSQNQHHNSQSFDQRTNNKFEKELINSHVVDHNDKSNKNKNSFDVSDWNNDNRSYKHNETSGWSTEPRDQKGRGNASTPNDRNYRHNETSDWSAELKQQKSGRGSDTTPNDRNYRHNETSDWSAELKQQKSGRGSDTTPNDRSYKHNETSDWSAELKKNKQRDSYSGESSDNSFTIQANSRNESGKTNKTDRSFNRDKGGERGGYKSNADKPFKDFGQNQGSNYFERKNQSQRDGGTGSSYQKNNYEGRQTDQSDTSGHNTGSRSSSEIIKEKLNLSCSSSETDNIVEIKKPFKDLDITLNTIEDVSISWWTSPHEFYIFLKSDKKNIEKLMKDIQKFYKNRPSTILKPAINDSVIAHYNKDNVFCRAKIIDYNEEIDKYKVEFIDFGNKKIVTINDLWNIDQSFMNLSKMTVHCSLQNIVLNCDQQTLLDKIDNYMKKGDTIKCEFLKKDNEMYFVDVNVNGKNLRERLIEENIVSPLLDEIKLSTLTGQTIRITLIEIKDLSCFRIKIDGCETILICSYSDMKFAKTNLNASKEFKNLYLNKTCAAKIESVSKDNILLVTPFISLLNETRAPLICNYPILSDKLEMIVTYVENNTIYAHLKNANIILNDLLDKMFVFYEKEGTNLSKIELSSLCAAKSLDCNWYRSIILADETLDNDKVKVNYIDYGNTEILPKNNLKKLEAIYCITSALATKIYLPIEVISSTDITEKEIGILTHGYEKLEFVLLEQYDNNIIGDINFNGQYITDVLIKKNLVKRIEFDKLYQQIKKDNVQKIQYFEEFIEEPENEAEPEPEVYIENEIIEHYENPIILKGINAILSHVDNPDRFYLQLESNLKHIDKLQENLQIIASSLPQLTELNVGVLCIAQYSGDENWYRAKIIDHGLDVVTIQFIDYGNTDVVTENGLNLLKEMHEEFSKAEPYAIPCSLPIRSNYGKEWNEKSLERFNCALYKSVRFEYLTKCSKEVIMNYVSLYIDDNEDLCNILCKEGLGIKLETIKSGEIGFIAHINSLSDFYIQLDCDTECLEKLSGYLSNEAEFIELTEFKEGLICRAQFPEDELYYRAKILFHSENDGTEVLFIDYGNTAITKKLYELTKDIAEGPFLSKKCTLYMPPDILKWSEAAEVKFRDLTASGETEFIVEMYKPGDESVIVNILIDGRNILDELAILCEKKVITNYQNCSESIVDELIDLVIKDTNHGNEELYGVVCHVNSPNDFYVHLDADKDSLDILSEYFSENVQNLEVLNDKIEGTICAALFSEDEQFYRAKVISSANDGYDVLFIDYGNASFATDLRVLTDEIAKIKPLAQHYGLENKNTSNEWNSASSSKFIDLTACGTTRFQIEIVDKDVDPCIVRMLMGPINVNNELIALIPTKINENLKTTDINEPIQVDTVIENSNNVSETLILTKINENLKTVDINEEIQIDTVIENSNDVSETLIENEIVYTDESSVTNTEVVNGTNEEILQTKGIINEIITEILDRSKETETDTNTATSQIIDINDKKKKIINEIINDVLEFPGVNNKLIDSENLRIHLRKSLEKLNEIDKIENVTHRSSTSNLHHNENEMNKNEKSKSTINLTSLSQ